MRKSAENKIKLSNEQKRMAIQEIKEYFAYEREEILGDLAAELVLDFITEKVGPYIYNLAVLDVQEYMNEKVEDMYGLMK